MADQRGRRPLPGVVADRQAMGRPVPGWRVDERPVVTRENITEQDQRGDHEAVREPSNPAAGRPVQLASRLGIAPSTGHRILTTARLNRLSYVDRATGELVRRYEHPHPGSLVHVDVKELGNIPDGGGWRYVGRRQGERNRAATPGKPKSKWHNP